MRRTRENKGVTLITWVITIIVLLILTSIALIILFGSKGIIKEQEAEEMPMNEQKNLNYVENYLDDYSSGTNSKILEEKMTKAEIQGDKNSLSDVVDGVPIPKGFTVSTVSSENTKDGGLVIKDSSGNEFVWVPVRDLDADGTRDGTNYDQQFGRRLFGRSEQLGGTVPTADEWTENIEENALDLIQSVEEYGGFYIARYEASYEEGKAVSRPSTTALTTAWTPTNGRLWNNISQLDAITACESMYGDEAKVKSHLPYGAEWDSILQWFKQTKFSNSDAPIGYDSTSWGNYYNASFAYGPSSTQKDSYTMTLIDTGSTEYTKVNNIYDITGNSYKWTQEKYGTGTGRACRGGGSYNDGSYSPAAYRDSGSETGSGSDIGFRPAIYIK